MKFAQDFISLELLAVKLANFAKEIKEKSLGRSPLRKISQIFHLFMNALGLYETLDLRANLTWDRQKNILNK
jgi:hypothetical protein